MKRSHRDLALILVLASILAYFLNQPSRELSVDGIRLGLSAAEVERLFGQAGQIGRCDAVFLSDSGRIYESSGRKIFVYFVNGKVSCIEGRLLKEGERIVPIERESLLSFLKAHNWEITAMTDDHYVLKNGDLRIWLMKRVNNIESIKLGYRGNLLKE